MYIKTFISCFVDDEDTTAVVNKAGNYVFFLDYKFFIFIDWSNYFMNVTC